VVDESNEGRSRVGLEYLIRKAQSSDLDDTAAMNEIIRRFEPLADRLANTTTSDKALREDLRNAARLALVRAVRRHDLRREGFPAFAGLYMRGAVNREQQRWLPPVEPGAGSPAPERESLEDDTAEIVIDRLEPWGNGEIAAAVEELTPSQRRIATLRYRGDAALEQIACVVGTSESTVSRRLSTIHRVITGSIYRP
jgi:RNA polymerase sigma factor (sigma-70 family)